jgi:hypothetical protein
VYPTLKMKSEKTTQKKAVINNFNPNEILQMKTKIFGVYKEIDKIKAQESF